MTDGKKVIGILGGVGPEATGNFYLKIITRLQQGGLVRSNKDFPQILVNSIPAPELTGSEVSDKDLMPYIEGLKELENFGVDFIVMACNTAHIFLDHFKEEVNVPICDLRKAVKAHLKKKGVKKVLILGTPLTVKYGLYKYSGFQYFNLRKKEVMELSRAVLSFNLGQEKGLQAEKAREIARRYIAKGAELIILGCTELSLMLSNGKAAGSKLDPMDILAEETIRFCIGNRS